MKESEPEAAKPRLTLCDPMDCSLRGSSILGTFRARVLEWGAIAFSNIGVKPINNAVIVSGEQRDSTIHIHVSVLYLRLHSDVQSEQELGHASEGVFKM